MNIIDKLIGCSLANTSAEVDEYKKIATKLRDITPDCAENLLDLILLHSNLKDLGDKNSFIKEIISDVLHGINYSDCKTYDDICAKHMSVNTKC
ncbi:hypothetical protein P261_02752 [Lachnospiraceae bacterium TWA4]|nr:hypothetical protein P261_02752 [Lachnospiraceae bacterium TWA4]